MRFDVISVFPELFTGVLDCGIIRRARQAGLVDIRLVNLRDFTHDRHKSVDDRPYGGGEGMIFMPGPLFDAVEFCRASDGGENGKVVFLTPQGNLWTQEMAGEFAVIPHLILICGRYEGVDQRVIDHLVDIEVSIGDFILTGGEIPAMTLIDSVVRLLPGALGCGESAVNESFSTGLLDYPQYTRPAEYRGYAVPDVLLSGDHAKIEKWRKEKALEKTRRVRPELIARRPELEDQAASENPEIKACG
jgi:tRNA (guanine37-N1)-methyltransferase